LDAEANMI